VLSNCIYGTFYLANFATFSTGIARAVVELARERNLFLHEFGVV
jgi:hypothetical protein